MLGAPHLAFVVTATLLGAAPSPAPAAAPAPASAQTQRFSTLLVASEGLDPTSLDAALGLRLPDLALEREWTLDSEDVDALGRYAFVHLARPQPGAPISLELITAEGDAYLRSLEDGEDGERLAASFVVSLLASIEAEELEADRVDIQAPTSADQQEVARAVTVAKGEAEPELAEPEPAEPESAEPEPESEPEPPPSPPEPIISSWQLAPTLRGGALFTLPDEGSGHILAGGGAIGLTGRDPRGLLLGAELRVLARARDDTSLTRVRLAGLVGWAWRPDDLPVELPLAAVIGFEPWFVRQGDALIPASELGTQSTLTNLGLSFAPAYLRELDDGPLAALRIGGRLELTTAFVFDDGLESMLIANDLGDPLYRLGGLELGLGLDLALYLRPRGDARSR